MINVVIYLSLSGKKKKHFEGTFQLVGQALLTVLIVCFFVIRSSVVAEPFSTGLANTDEIPSQIRGTVWIQTLGCTACHADDGLSGQHSIGPDLTRIGDRVRSGWLQSYLERPQESKPGTVMPDVLNALPSDERADAVQALTHFLISQKGSDEGKTQALSGSVENGKRLFHSVGCFACHPFGEALEFSSWFKNVQAKFRPDALVEFLKDPLRVHSNGTMPDLNLSHDEASDVAAFLSGQSVSPDPSFQVNKTKADQGQRLFGKLGCAQCHASLSTKLGQMDPPIHTAPRLRSLDPLKGCLSSKSGPWPDYDLSADQVRDMVEALRSQSPLSASDRIQVRMIQHNCITCHQRDGLGGVAESLDAFFTTSDLNLGEQGRVPPSLDGVGGKLNPVWLRRVLVQGAVARPYLNVRMPRFGAGVADHLVDLLVETDALPAVGDVEMPNMNDSRRAGRDLAGTDGMACITCHTFKGTKTGAMGGIDMTLHGQRLNRDWFHQYMANPQRFRPGTLMPDFWPEGHSSKPEILEGDATKQIEALWFYLLDGYSVGTPKGVHREPMRLLASQSEAVMLRRSYPGVGKRGIGVGYPQGVNLVFNAEQLCLSMIWKGDFADPAGVWLSQGHGNVRPMARQQIRFPNASQIQVLADEQSPWSDGSERSENHAFKGYRLDEQRRPTFLYEVDGVLLTDTFRDVALDESIVLQREISCDALVDSRSFIFRAGQGKTVTALGNQRFQLDQDLIIELLQGGEPFIVNVDDQQELRIRIRTTEKAEPLKLNYDF